MEDSEMKRPIADRRTVEKNLERIVRMLSDGESFDLKLNGRRVFFSEGTQLEVELVKHPRSGTLEINIKWGDRQAESTRRKIGAKVIRPAV